MTTADNTDPGRRVVDKLDQPLPSRSSSWVQELLGWSKDIVVAVMGAILIVIFVGAGFRNFRVVNPAYGRAESGHGIGFPGKYCVEIRRALRLYGQLRGRFGHGWRR